MAGRANIPLEKKSRMRLINIPICMCVDMDDNVLECLNTHTQTQIKSSMSAGLLATSTMFHSFVISFMAALFFPPR